MKTVIIALVAIISFGFISSSSNAQTNNNADIEFVTMHAGVGYQTTSLKIEQIFTKEELQYQDSLSLITIINRVRQLGYKAACGVTSYFPGYKFVTIQSKETATMTYYTNGDKMPIERNLTWNDKVSTFDTEVTIEVFKEVKQN